jgi:glyoxylase-like metal-dependent hydrolase (beta-lactamase superfamily II)
MNRRKLLKQTGLLTISSLMPVSETKAFNTGQYVITPTAGHFRFKLGDLEMIVVTDGHIFVNPAQPIFAPGIPKQHLEAALNKNFIGNDAIDSAINILVIIKGERIILFDTGCGAALGNNSGHFLKNLQAAGIPPEKVTDILITHLHVDHIGGILMDQGEPVFKNAVYYLPEIEHNFWMSQKPDFSKSKNPASPLDSIRLARKIVNAIADKLHLFPFGTTLFDCVRCEQADGHTPGHPLLTVFSGEKYLTHIVDIVHTPLLLSHPEWGTQWDTDFERGVHTRQRILRELSLSKLLVMSCHLPWPGLGYIVPEKTGYRWAPFAISTPQLYEG